MLSGRGEIEDLCVLIDENPSIGYWVKELSFDVLGRGSEKMKNAGWIFDVGYELGPMLRNLSHIELQGFDDGGEALASFSFVNLSEFGSVRSLTIRLCRVAFESLASLLINLPLLSSLSIYNCIFLLSDWPIEGEVSLRRLSHLAWFETYGLECKALRWLLVACDPQVLHSLTLDTIRSCLPLSNEFLEALGPSLLHLRLKFQIQDEKWRPCKCRILASFDIKLITGHSVAVLEGLDLGHNTGIQTLELDRPRDLEYLDIETQLAFPNFHTLSFVETDTEVRHFKDEDYTRLNAQLSCTDTRHLKRLCFVYEELSEPERALERANLLLPSASSRGLIVTVETRENPLPPRHIMLTRWAPRLQARLCI